MATGQKNQFMDGTSMRRLARGCAQHLTACTAAPCTGTGKSSHGADSSLSWPSMVPPKAAMDEKPKLAVVSTVWSYFTHPEHMGDCFLHGWGMGGQWHEPGLQVVSMYVDQQAAFNPHDDTAETDIYRQRALEFGFELYDDIAEALRCGGDSLAVDAVLIIGEHGNYPYNEFGQHLYPRYRFFREVTRVFREDGRSVPVFNDKHLSWRFKWAKEMVDTSYELDFPLMAGSSLPVAWRMPPVDMPLGAQLEEVMGVGYGGVDSYDFHSLETIQCMVERRKGGETGVKWVEATQGEGVWRTLLGNSDEAPSLKLLEACLSRSHSLNMAQGAGNGGFCKRFPSVDEMREMAKEPYMIRYEYTDGVRATCLLLSGLVNDFTFAGKIVGEEAPLATLHYLDSYGGHGDHGKGPGSNVQYSSILMSGAERMFLSGKAHVPIERTLLTGGMVEAGCQSLTLSKRIETPHLAGVSYQPPHVSNFGFA